MNERPYIWMSIVGAVLVVMALWAWGFATGALAWLNVCSSVLGTVGGGLLLWALWLVWLTAWEQASLNYQTRRRADSQTPLTILSENMKQMHPAAIDVLKMYGRATWMIIPGAKPEDQAQYILYGTQCTWDFIAEYLRSSNNTSVVAEWRFANEGAKHYAPTGMQANWCTDREQYKQLTAFLYGLGRITLAHGNQPPAWIPPWSPMTVARVMGIKFENDQEENEDEAPEIEEAPKTVTTLRDAFPQAN